MSQPTVKIPSNLMKDVTCPACGGVYFFQIVKVKTYNGVMTGGNRVDAVVPALRCVLCLHIVGEPITKEI